MILHADCSWRDTQLVPWLSALRSRDSAGPEEAALEAPKHHSGHSDPPAAPHAVWKGPGGPSLEPRVLTNPRGFQHPLVAEATGGYHPILLGLPVPGERSVLPLGSHSDSWLPACLPLARLCCCCTLGFFYTEKVSLPPPSFFQSLSLFWERSGAMWESMFLQPTRDSFRVMLALQPPEPTVSRSVVVCEGVFAVTICILWVELLNSLGRASGFPLAWFWLLSIQNWAPGPQRQSCSWVDADV